MWPCLPKEVTEETPVLAQESEPSTKKTQQPMTVGAALRKVDARCQEGKLVDRNGKEIYFFHRAGCWGNPPDNYAEILDLQTREIERLKKDYTVLEIPCGSTDPAAVY